MSLTRALATVNEARGADPTLPWGSSYIPTNGQLGFTAAGVTMNDDAALSVATVAACIALIADSISSLPLRMLRKTKDDSIKQVDRVPPLIQNPWPEGTIQDWVQQVMISLLLRGNFYGLVCDRDDAGRPTVIMPVHPDDVIARRNPRSGLREYRIKSALVPTDNIMHIPGPLMVPGSFVALNPVEYQRQSWALAAAAEKYGGQLFGNSAMPSGILTTDQEMEPAEALELRREWEQYHRGLGNAQNPAVLTGGLKYQQISMTPDQAQFILTRAHQREQIISWFRIPPHKMGITDRTPVSGQTAEDLEAAFVRDALLPYATRIESYLSDDKITARSQYVKFDFSSRMRGNTLQRATATQMLVNTGQWTADEARALFDMEPLPNDMGKLIGRPYNMAFYSTVTGELVSDPTLGDTVDPNAPVQPAPPNPGGLGGGGGNPDTSPTPP